MPESSAPQVGFSWEDNAVYIPIGRGPTGERDALNRLASDFEVHGAGNSDALADYLAYSYRTEPDVWPGLIDAARTDALAYKIARDLCWNLRYPLIEYHTEFPAHLLQDPSPEDWYLWPNQQVYDYHAHFAVVHANAVGMAQRKGYQITRQDTFDCLIRGLRQLRTWCADIASGRVSPPRKPGRVASYNMPRDVAIVLAIDELQAVTNLPVMSFSSRSACEAVGERIGLDAEAVYAVYKKKSTAILEQKARTLSWAAEIGLT